MDDEIDGVREDGAHRPVRRRTQSRLRRPKLSAITDRAPNTFDRLKAVVFGGHLRDLTENEVKAWVALLAHSDGKTGEAYPSMELLAWEIGTNNLNRARKAV